MNAIENMITRRSVRGYKSDMVPKEIIEKSLRQALMPQQE